MAGFPGFIRARGNLLFGWDSLIAFPWAGGGLGRINLAAKRGCWSLVEKSQINPNQTLPRRPGGVVCFRKSGQGRVMVHAKLGTGNENSGKLVAKVKNEAKASAEKSGKQIILVDGSPGVGCPVVSSLSGASYVVLVTEPTVSGLHDLRRS